MSRSIRILAGRHVIEGQPDAAVRALRDELKKVHGDTVTIIDKNGDPINYKVGDYAHMVATTKTREATCKARHERLKEQGIDLVTIVGKQSKYPCSQLLGKVFSLSGDHQKYPALSSLGGGPPFHPNCSKSTAPFVEDLADEAALQAAEPDPETEKIGKLIANRDWSAAMRLFKDTGGAAEAKQRVRDIAAGIKDRLPNAKPWDAVKEMPRGETGLEVSRALNAMGQVVSLPKSADTITIGSETLSGARGYYAPARGYIAIDPSGPSQRSTTVHEFGHYIDNRIFAGSGEVQMGSHIDPEVRKAILSIAKSDAIQQLLHIHANSDDARVKGYVTYLLNPAEIFARAYAQYVTVKTDNPVLREQLDAIRKDGSPIQWTDADFASVSRAITKLLKQKGLQL